MAAPIAHIFCALSLLNGNAINIDNIAHFIIGTSFPDIRYLGVIKREETHVENITWNDVINAPTPFKAGLLVHSLLDKVREAFVVKNNLYKFVPDSPFRTQILKFYEDIILYEMIKNWPDIIHYFDTILPEECAYNIKKNDIKIWHDLLKRYFLQQPDTNQILMLLQQRTTLDIQKEHNLFKKFFILCKGALINRIAYFKITSTLHKLKKYKKLNAAIKFFYKNVNTFLTEQ
jgi:hypothetical protein